MFYNNWSRIIELVFLIIMSVFFTLFYVDNLENKIEVSVSIVSKKFFNVHSFHLKRINTRVVGTFTIYVIRNFVTCAFGIFIH